MPFPTDEEIKALPLLDRTKAMTAKFAHKFSPGLSEEFLYETILVDARKCIEWIDMVSAYHLENGRNDVAEKLVPLRGIAAILHSEETMTACNEMTSEIADGRLDQAGSFGVMLSSCGNPDHGQNPEMGLPGVASQVAHVKSLREASLAVQKYIDEHDLGAGNWSGGQVTTASGSLVAKISYNGRVWWKEGTTLFPEPRKPRAASAGLGM